MGLRDIFVGSADVAGDSAIYYKVPPVPVRYQSPEPPAGMSDFEREMNGLVRPFRVFQGSVIHSSESLILGDLTQLVPVRWVHNPFVCRGGRWYKWQSFSGGYLLVDQVAGIAASGRGLFPGGRTGFAFGTEQCFETAAALFAYQDALRLKGLKMTAAYRRQEARLQTRLLGPDARLRGHDGFF